MFKFVVLCVFVLSLESISARPQEKPTPIPIISQSQSLDGAGRFDFAFESADGIKEQGNGELRTGIKVPKIDPKTGAVIGEQEGAGIVQRGSYSYTSPEGQLIEVTYIADENVSSSEDRVFCSVL